MAHMKIMVIILVGLSLILSGIMGCGGSDSNIVGKWKDESGYTFEFFEDKTFTGPVLAGTWTILSDGRIKISTSGGAIWTATIQGDSLIIQNGLYRCKKVK